MKVLSIVIALLIFNTLSAQENKPETILTAPDDWRMEIINLPLSFAPSLDYTGFEDIRFAPGWSDTTAADYFTYTFTWVLDKNPKLDRDKLETQMKAYFDGLMEAVSGRKDLPKTEADFSFAGAKRDFGATGTVKFYEAFFKKKVVSLNVNVAGKRCPELGKYLVRFDLSPQPSSAEVWKGFDQVKLKEDCGN